MLLEKIRKHAGKLMVLCVNVLLVWVGSLLLDGKKQQLDFKAFWQEKKATELADSISLRLLEIEKMKKMQQTAVEYRNKKLESIANNSESITVQKPVVVTRIIPGKTIQTANSGSSAKQTSATKTKTS